MPAFQFVAILAATLFSGAAIYINLAEHPARMECGTEFAVTVFGPSYRRAAVLQVILALTATIAGLPLDQWPGFNPTMQREVFEETKTAGATIIKLKGGSSFACQLDGGPYSACASPAGDVSPVAA